MTTAVFLPGFLCDERVWQNQTAALANEIQCEVLDLRHCQNLEAMVQKVVAVAEPTFHLVGFSMGGYVAQVFASRYPERLSSLCIVASSGGPLSATEIAGRKRIEAVLKVAKYKGISPREMHRYVHPLALQKPTITDLIVEMSATNSSEMYLRQMHATLDRQDYRQALQQMDFPMAIFGGLEDKVATPAELEAFAQVVNRAQFQLIPECGHYVPLEKPEELTTLLRDFLLKS